MRFLPNYPAYGLRDGQLLTLTQRMGTATDVTGNGVVMAFVDSGFYPHPDLAGRIRLFVDATTDKIAEKQQVDVINMASWHGMMTTVVAAGDGSLSGGHYRGLASSAELVLIKVSSPTMRVQEADIQRGLAWLLANHAKHQVRIVNISAGGDAMSTRPDHPIHASIARLVDDGLVVVVAAGNQGIQHLVPPANTTEAIVVGGYDDRNSLRPHSWRLYNSNYGYARDTSTKPDLVALAQWVPAPVMPETPVAAEAQYLGRLLHENPNLVLADMRLDGHALLAALDVPRESLEKPTPKFYELLQKRIHAHKLINAHYQHVDGTSVAAPIVASVAAQMLEVNPNLTPEQVGRILKRTARPLRGVPPIKQGAGVVQPAAAVRFARGYY